jgi:phosphonatase-like hydrolase
MIELAAFDIAGTTVEEHQAVYVALSDAVQAAGSPVTDADIRAWMGADKRQAIRALLGGGPDLADGLVESTFLDFRSRLDRAYADRPPTPLPGVPEAFAALRRLDVKIALTTGFDRDVTDAVLAAAGWSEGVLDAVICADDVPEGRPAPYMIFRAMEATGTHDVRRVVTAGDTTLDLEAGSNAGAAIVAGVLTGAQDRATLSQAPHTHILDSITELPGLIALL